MKTKYVKATFFFIKKKVDDKEIQVMDCPAGEMRMSFLSSYQHLGTQSQRAYHDDGVAFPWIGIKQCP